MIACGRSRTAARSPTGLEQALLAAGERDVRVPPQRMGASRKGEREPGKSDEIDALAVARVVVKDGVERFPVAYLNEQAMEIRLLLDHRNDLVAERTRTINRLRWTSTRAVHRARALAEAQGVQ
jgi:transposase